MKNLFISVAMTMMLGLGACSHFETSGNGKLDGYWQLTHVDTLESGRTGDVRDRMIFWSVQANLIEMNDLHENPKYGEKAPSVFYHFEIVADTLRLLSEPKPLINNRRISDRVADRLDVVTYGLSHLGEDLLMLRLTDEKLTLQSERLRMYFRKY